MRAVIYTRVSREEQVRKGLSLDAQETACRDYCQRADLTVAAVIRDEGVSAGIPLGDRPGGRQVLQLLGGGQCSHVVSLKLDRMFRDVQDATVQTRAWLTLGVTLHLLDMGAGPVDTQSSAGEFSFNIMSSVAQYERKRTGERVKDALRKLTADGRQTGFAPLGYTRDGKTTLVDPDEGKIVRDLFTRYSRGASQADCARWLNGLGVSTRYGNAWCTEVVGRVLRNEFYRGVVHDHGGIADGAHEAIIGARLWGRVQDRLSQQKSFSPASRRDSWTPLYRCGICGSGVTQHCTSTARPIETQLRCRARSRMPQELRHEAVNVPMLKANHHVWQAVRTAITGGTVAGWVEEARRRSQARTKADDVGALEERLAEVRSQLGRALDAYMRGAVDAEMMETRARPLRQEEAALGQRIAALLAQEVDAGVSAGLELGLKRLDGFGDLQRRDFLLGVLDRVEVNRGRLVAVFRLPDEPSVEITLPRYWSPNRGKH